MAEEVEKLAHSLFDQWNQALLKNEKQVTLFYKPGALLLPTISSEFCNDFAKIKYYFSVFCQRKPQGKITHSQVFYHKKILILAGHYLVTFDKREKAQARFTFVFEKVKKVNEGKLGSDWLIAHQHSSLFP